MFDTYLADMGGIAIRFGSNTDNATVEDPEKSSKQTTETDITPTQDDTNNQSTSAQATQLKKSTNTINSVATVTQKTIEIKEDSCTDLEPGTPRPAEPIQDFANRQKRYDSRYGAIPWKSHPNHSKIASGLVPEGAKENEVDKIAALSGDIWLLGSSQLLIARNRGVIKKLPEIEKEGMSRSNDLVKLLALLQLIWLIIQLITRKIRRLPFAPLEVNAVAFAASALIIYIIEWRKPQDVPVPVYVDAVGAVPKEIFSEILEESSVRYGRRARRYTTATSSLYKVPVFDGEETTFRNVGLHLASFLVFLGSPLLFGGIHLFAWDVSFPTPVERELWKVSAILTTALPFALFVVHFKQNKLNFDENMLSFAEGGSAKNKNPFVNFCRAIMAILYIAVRLFIMAESFRSLYYLTSDTFKSIWAANMPHVG
ncbi:hypothetical protein PT974_07233 [Cladobotryum mycophilum]|uniref:Uncharacterized protein n=1 Tax=Cladobotryum mycophilum TaxID=491253 RepID=A0ABR0SPU4_9HYPO